MCIESKEITYIKVVCVGPRKFTKYETKMKTKRTNLYLMEETNFKFKLRLFFITHFLCLYYLFMIIVLSKGVAIYY